MFFLFVFSVSIIFLWGVGTERLYIQAGSSKGILLGVIRPLIASCLSLILCSGLIFWVLIPLKLNFTIPIFIGLITYLCIFLLDLGLHNFIQQRVPEEKLFIYGTVFLCLYTAENLLHAVYLCIAVNVSLLVCSVILHAIKERIYQGYASKDWKTAPLLLISMGFIAMAFYATDVLWSFL
ncbi:hypothetical protein DWQ65_09050 [Treponema phagedenis]|uniref:Uncharacterized protein n=1 Tax=Treponema phagedenis TaxID=162 RepID=A0A0B7GZY5_TREPH|nr:hypothetical protein [Treponema phagedenis]NVP24192.1 hypothetical protein [Treponema phagedenis]QEJ94164.1 hypothetical protein FUT79_02310 [Treponema phagedenis]QEJ99249.1 hypothetical protein FUT82_15490 [Treponema phagedenis]QEK00123.1 hypothetical protein FUT84_02265 [Treponema phagedenis]QEK04816.1 hypothetical protein FUT83_14120 [Treponema phagedenis]